MALLEDMLAELHSEHAELAPIMEGLQDYNQVGLVKSKATITTAIADTTRRQQLIQTAINALTHLANDGYPERTKRVLDAEIYAELQDQVRTMTAALGEFGEEPTDAQTVHITAGQPEAKG